MGYQIDEFDPANVATAYDRAQRIEQTSGRALRYTADGIPIGWEAQKGGQVRFLRSPLFEVLLEGNRGGGKTEVLLADFCQHCGIRGPDKPLAGYGRYWRGILFRKSYPDLADVIEKSHRVIPPLFPAAVYNQQTHIWRWPWGESLRFAFAESEGDYWNYHGSEYPWIGWEELTTWSTDSLYLKMMSICRSSMPNMPRKYRSTTNPFGPGHSWVKTRFQLPQMRNGVIHGEVNENGVLGHDRGVVNVSLHENAALLAADPQYEATIMEAADDPVIMAAWINGRWDINAGGMFDDVFQFKTHVLPDFIPPPSWRIDRAYDDGSSAPFAVGWFAESDGSDLLLPNGVTMQTVRGDLFLIKEWYGMSGKPGKNEGLKMDSWKITKGIVERELQWQIYGRVNDGPADSAIFARNHGICVADDMRQPVMIEGKQYRGITWTEADKRPGTRIAGWKQIRAALNGAIPDPRTGRREKPGLYICEGCPQWLRTVPTLPRDEDNLDDVEFPEDHMGDMTRYRVHNPPRIIKVRATTGY